MRIAECTIGMLMRSSSSNEYTHYDEANNVWVSALVLENCTECYSTSNADAFRCGE